MLHTKEQVLLKARCLAKKLVAFAKREDLPADCHEIDVMAQDAQYILIDTDDLECYNTKSDKKMSETNTSNGDSK
jgi:hypothetical protein